MTSILPELVEQKIRKYLWIELKNIKEVYDYFNDNNHIWIRKLKDGKFTKVHKLLFRPHANAFKIQRSEECDLNGQEIIAIRDEHSFQNKYFFWNKKGDPNNYQGWILVEVKIYRSSIQKKIESNIYIHFRDHARTYFLILSFISGILCILRSVCDTNGCDSFIRILFGIIAVFALGFLDHFISRRELRFR